MITNFYKTFLIPNSRKKLMNRERTQESDYKEEILLPGNCSFFSTFVQVLI